MHSFETEIDAQACNVSYWGVMCVYKDFPGHPSIYFHLVGIEYNHEKSCWELIITLLQTFFFNFFKLEQCSDVKAISGFEATFLWKPQFQKIFLKYL